jgi:ornithine cyclodeaminase/alanine dehydrogenase
MSDQPATHATLPYLSEPILEGLSITTDEVVDSIEQLIVGQQRGQVWCAPKVVVFPGDERYIMATLAAAEEPRIVATKSLVLNPRNRQRGLAAINSLVTLLDGETGLPLAVVDGNWVTARRTSGLSAVAAKRLARRRLYRLWRPGAKPSRRLLRNLPPAGDSCLRARHCKPGRALPGCGGAGSDSCRQRDR